MLPLAFGHGFRDDAFLEEMQLAAGRIGLLLDGGQEQRVQLRVLLFDLPGDGPIVRLPAADAAPEDCRGQNAQANQRWHGPGQGVTQQRPAKKNGQPDQRRHRPTSGQGPGPAPPPQPARDGFKLGF